MIFIKYTNLDQDQWGALSCKVKGLPTPTMISIYKSNNNLSPGLRVNSSTKSYHWEKFPNSESNPIPRKTTICKLCPNTFCASDVNFSNIQWRPFYERMTDVPGGFPWKFKTYLIALHQIRTRGRRPSPNRGCNHRPERVPQPIGIKSWARGICMDCRRGCKTREDLELRIGILKR